MKILYIDESGDTVSFEQGGKKTLVLNGCIIDEKDKRDIELKFRAIKEKYYQNPDIEIKSNFLRYANPKISDPEKTSPIKLFDQGKYDSLQQDIQNFLKDIPVFLITVVIDKKGFWSEYPSQNPYDMAYVNMVMEFQKYLDSTDSMGICIIDPREGRVIDKKLFDKDLDSLHRFLQWKNFKEEYLCPRIIEKALFSDSALTVGIQISDLYCYPVFNVFEYDKKPGEYAWFDDISKPKLLNGKLEFSPEKTKKDFRFYE